MLAVRTPEYFPRLAFLALAAQADRLVVADTFQYSRQSFQNRARLCTPDGAMWITVPLVGGQHGRALCHVEVDDRRDWRQTHLKALRYNYGATPFYAEYAPRVEALLVQPWPTLGALNVATVAFLAGALGLTTPCERASAMTGAPATLEAVRARFDASLLALPDAAAHDGAAPLRWHETPRRQPFPGPFRPDCSALDALFLYGPDARALLHLPGPA